ncbi:MAG: allophanate hydrolase subunit 1 [Burkholderiales bacterium]
MSDLHPMAESPRLLPLGDAALTVEFGSEIDAPTHAKVLGFTAALDEAQAMGALAGVAERVPTFRSVTVHFDPDQVDVEALATQLRELAQGSGSRSVAGVRWAVPFCCDTEFALDLADVAQAKSMSAQAVLDLLTATVFQVYMLGFLPGFAFMGGLPQALEMPRLSSPRKRVPPGSVAIALRLCGAYPWESPGGWRVLGRTPVPLFDPRLSGRPTLLAPGDEVRWRAVDRAEYDDIVDRVKTNRFDRAALQVAAPAEAP